MKRAAIVGGGPAGLMAAETLAREGVHVTVYDAKPSLGRKFLMAGKSGLNLTKDAPADHLVAAYDTGQIAPMIRAFDAQAVKSWAESLGQPVFTGSSGRVFPKAMKASPLLRAWLRQLTGLGVEFRTLWRWTGFSESGLSFQTPEGERHADADVSVLAMGGASWSRLGADGLWAPRLAAHGVSVVPFSPSNAALAVTWSPHMRRYFGQAIKAVAWTTGSVTSRGEAIVSDRGLEGGGIYTISRAVGSGAALYLDLLPDLDMDRIIARLASPRKKASWTTFLRKRLDLTGVRLGLAQEWLRPFPAEPGELAFGLKNLPVRHHGPGPIDEAISTAGGIAFDAVTTDLMLRSVPGVFCAGEMLDWDAPTGGYLITGCLATGRWAGRGAVEFLRQAGRL